MSSLRPTRCRGLLACPSWHHEVPSRPAPECCGTSRRWAPRTWHEWCWCRSRCLQTANLSRCLPRNIHRSTANNWKSCNKCGNKISRWHVIHIMACSHHRQDSFDSSQSQFRWVSTQFRWVSTQFRWVSTQFRWVLSHLVTVSNLQLTACLHCWHRRNKTVLSNLQLCSQRDKTRQFCLVRVGGVNKP